VRNVKFDKLFHEPSQRGYCIHPSSARQSLVLGISLKITQTHEDQAVYERSFCHNLLSAPSRKSSISLHINHENPQQRCMMDPKIAIWLASAALSVLALVKLMRRRQAKLINTLRTFVQNQVEWNAKRAKAARLARKLAKEKSREEQPYAAPAVSDFVQQSIEDDELWNQSGQKAA
jgi:hypothetical protein